MNNRPKIVQATAEEAKFVHYVMLGGKDVIDWHEVSEAEGDHYVIRRGEDGGLHITRGNVIIVWKARCPNCVGIGQVGEDLDLDCPKCGGVGAR